MKTASQHVNRDEGLIGRAAAVLEKA